MLTARLKSVNAIKLLPTKVFLSSRSVMKSVKGIKWYESITTKDSLNSSILFLLITVIGYTNPATPNMMSACTITQKMLKTGFL